MYALILFPLTSPSIAGQILVKILVLYIFMHNLLMKYVEFYDQALKNRDCV